MPRPRTVRRRAVLGTLAPLGLILVAATGTGTADARSRAPQLAGARCVPATAKSCKSGVAVAVGKQVQLRGTRLAAGQRVSFRWSRGALAAGLKRSRAGYVARVPAGTRAG